MDSDDAFADEIVEIFVEEVGEVLEQIDRHYPVWYGDGRNVAALKEVRRAFHTLKGSGRMVQANEIGELAWAVENLLNRLLDGTLRINDHIYELIEEVRKVIPVLLEAFAKRQAAALAGINTGRLIEQADALREGREVTSIQTYQAPEGVESPLVSKAVLGGGVQDDELEQLQEQLAGIRQSLDEHKRSWVNLGGQVDALRNQLNALPETMGADDIRRQLEMADREIKELKYFVKATSSEMVNTVNEAQQRLTARVDQELRIVADVSGQIKADMTAEFTVLRAELNNRIKAWSLGSAIACSVLLLLAAAFLL
ncbi:MAG TPA: Hpt domain-containing protein [Pseudomonadales bacterium]